MAANIELNQTETELKRKWKASSGNKKDGVNNLLPTVGEIMAASCEMKGEAQVQKGARESQCHLEVRQRRTGATSKFVKLPKVQLSANKIKATRGLIK